MSRTTSTTDLGNGLTKTVENRDGSIHIDIDGEGKLIATIERVAVTRINGEAVGGPQTVRSIRLSDDQIRLIPGFDLVFGTIAAASDAAELAIEAQRAQPAPEA